MFQRGRRGTWVVYYPSGRGGQSAVLNHFGIGNRNIRRADTVRVELCPASHLSEPSFSVDSPSLISPGFSPPSVFAPHLPEGNRRYGQLMRLSACAAGGQPLPQIQDGFESMEVVARTMSDFVTMERMRRAFIPQSSSGPAQPPVSTAHCVVVNRSPEVRTIDAKVKNPPESSLANNFTDSACGQAA